MCAGVHPDLKDTRLAWHSRSTTVWGTRAVYELSCMAPPSGGGDDVENIAHLERLFAQRLGSACQTAMGGKGHNRVVDDHLQKVYCY